MDLLASPRTLVMGIVNVTPDSFSDGGDHFDTDAAIGHGRLLLAQGADILDVGGESTRPGAERPDEAEELRRVVPVVRALAAEGAVVSVDTMRANVARAVAEAGAAIINDVAGGLADEAMLPTVAELGLPYICMHWRGHGAVMNAAAVYDDVVAEVVGELEERVEACLGAGIERDRLILDPGFGFSKDVDHNWELMRHLDQVERMGFPLLVGVSRKRFLGDLLAEGGTPRPPKERDAATAAITTLMAERGIWAVRTHEVRDQRDAVEVVARLRRA